MKKGLFIFLGALVFLLLLRLAMEPVAEHYVNRTLQNMEGYNGHVKDIDIQLFRGAYRVEGIAIQTVEDSISIPFVTIDTMDLSVHWDALMEGKVVGEVVLYRPVVNFVSEKEGEDEQTGEETDWVATLEELMPLKINRFEIRNGSIAFKDPSVQPAIDIQLQELFLVAQNLSNIRDSLQELPASLSASATSIGGGKLDLDMRMDFMKDIPDFHAQLQFMSVDLTALNDFIKAYGNFDVHEGTFSLITEMQAEDGRITGYIKPFFENLDIFSLEEDMKGQGFFQKVWEGLLGIAGEVLENQPKDRVATEVPIDGSISSPDTNVPMAIFNIFRNAFVDAIEKEFGRQTQES